MMIIHKVLFIKSTYNHHLKSFNIVKKTNKITSHKRYYLCLNLSAILLIAMDMVFDVRLWLNSNTKRSWSYCIGADLINYVPVSYILPPARLIVR